MLPLLLLLAVGCVPKGQYEALEADLAGTRSTLETRIAEREGSIADLETALATEERRRAELADQVEALEARHARELEQLRGEKSELMRDRSALAASVQEMEAALADLHARTLAADQRVAEFRDLLGRFQELIDAGRLRVKIVDGRMVVELATDILFDSGSATLSADGQSAIVEVGEVLADMEDRQFQVEGHTDNVPIRTERFPSNWELAAARAITVVRTLTESGVPASRLSGASYADLRPVASNDDREGRALNRRIEIVLLPDLSLLPGFEELQEIAAEDAGD